MSATQTAGERAISTLQSFIVQAVSGVLMAQIRGLGAIDPRTGPVYLARYINDCYVSLLNNTDAFVTDTFAAFSSHGPVCIFHIVFQIGQLLLEQHADFTAVGPIDGVRSTLQHSLSEAIKVIMPDDILNHKCSGESVAALRASADRSPIFTFSSTP
eukprot:m.238431 g.238431  ORF g.238431 m.238431 type:complete len:157 (-) comp54354_c0_seq1:46-516(-)